MAGFAIYLQYMDALAILGYLGKSTKSLKINSKILQTDKEYGIDTIVTMKKWI